MGLIKSKWEKILAIMTDSISHCIENNKTKNPYNDTANSTHTWTQEARGCIPYHWTFKLLQAIWCTLQVLLQIVRPQKNCKLFLFVHMATSPEKHPAGSGPYANRGGIWSLCFPPAKNQQLDKSFSQTRTNTQHKIQMELLLFSKSYLLALRAPLHHLEFPDPIPQWPEQIKNHVK